jgi:formamidopyrimidine-DNA glycosylase
MPELPEVETVRRVLERHVVGRTVREIEGRSVQMRRPLDITALQLALSGTTIVGARRRGKFLLLDADTSGSLLLHLGMSGRLLLQTPAEPALPHTHLSLRFDDGRELRLVDPRRFGLACWLAPGAEATDDSLAALGMEPLDPRMPDQLPRLFGHRRSPLKVLLLDQRLVAGIGNIYAVEALWRAGIRPSRRAHRTAARRLERLGREVQTVLTEAIEQGGTTIRDFATPAGDFGYFAVRLAVYGHAGDPCPRCGAPIGDSRLGGRSTAWCPSCQR